MHRSCQIELGKGVFMVAIGNLASPDDAGVRGARVRDISVLGALTQKQLMDILTQFDALSKIRPSSKLSTASQVRGLHLARLGHLPTLSNFACL